MSYPPLKCTLLKVFSLMRLASEWSPVAMRSTISSRKSSTSLVLYPSLNRTVVNVLDVMASALIMTDPVCRWISRASTLLSPRLLELRLWKQH